MRAGLMIACVCAVLVCGCSTYKERPEENVQLQDVDRMMKATPPAPGDSRDGGVGAGAAGSLGEVDRMMRQQQQQGGGR
jgi:hypothetical protein